MSAGMRYQPQVGPARINALNPRAAGLISLFTPGVGEARQRRIVRTPGVSLAASPAGLVYQGSATFSSVDIGAPAGIGSILDQTKGFSWYGRFYIKNLNFVQTLVGDYNGSNDVASFTVRQGSDNSFNFDSAAIGGGGYGGGSYEVFPEGLHDFEMEITASPAYTQSLWIDGRLIGSITAPAGKTLHPGEKLRLMSLGTYAGGQWNQSRLLISAFWNRTRTAAERSAVRANPWQLFQGPDEDDFPTSSRPEYSLGAVPGAYSLTGAPAGVRAARQLATASGAYALIGNAAALRQGHVLAAIAASYSITGIPAGMRAARQMIAGAGTYAMVGLPTNLRQGHIATMFGGAYAISGNAVALRIGRRMVCAPGGFAITGAPAGLRAARALVAGGGNYVISGSDLAYVANRYISAEAGIYSLTGRAASLRAARRLMAAMGSVVVSGIGAGMSAGRRMPVNTGAFSIVGFATGLLYTPTPAPGRSLTAQSGVISIVGASATLAVGRRMYADVGAYSMAGGSAGLVVGRRIQAAPGSYAILGQAAGIAVARSSYARPASFLLTGFAVAMDRGRAPGAVEIAASRLYRGLREVRMYVGKAEQRVYRERIQFSN